MHDRELFIAALQLKTIEERIVYLNEACGTDQLQRQRIEKLLQRHEESESFLNPDLIERTAAFELSPAMTTTEAAGDQIGPFKLLQKLGDGGMGTVWVAEQEKPVKRRVALKLVKAGMDSAEVLRRFEAERQALAMMDHTNIAKVFDAGTNAQGRPYFVMELIKGVPITKYCDEVHASIRDRLDLFIQICSAVQHAHQKGIIHRDIKPSNVLVAMQDGKPVPKVIDFGVAKALHSKLADKTMYTEIGQVVGTLEYMAPEQAELSAMDIDTRADIYALGILLYELLTGSTPITRQRMKSAAFAEILRIIKEEEPPKPSTRLSESKESMASVASLRRTDPKHLSSELRGELDWVVLKALEKDRTRRYETANGLSRDLQRYLANETVEARPASVGYRLRKFVRRNRVVVVAAAMVFMALVGGLVMLYGGVTAARYGLERARDAEKAARADQEEAVKQRNEADRQRATAVEQRTKAEKARDRTRDVLDAMTSSATSDSLSAQEEISEDQKKFLAEVLTYYREFAGEKADDEQSRARTASAALRVGMIEYRLGRREQAIAAFQIARDGFRTLAADFPAVPTYRYEQAHSHNNLATQLNDMKKPVEAEEQLRQAMVIQEKLVADFPTVTDYQKGLAGTQSNLGLQLSSLAKPAEAEEQFRRALAAREKLVADFPAEPDYRHKLARSQSYLGILLKDLAKRAEAEKLFRQALANLEKLAVEFPTVPAYRQELAGVHNNLAILLGVLAKPTEAVEQYRIAIVIKEKLAADFPTVPIYRQALARTHNNLGLLLTNPGQHAEAEKQYRQALAYLEKLAVDIPTVPVYRKELSEIHNNLGNLLGKHGKPMEAEEQHRQGAVILEKLVAEFPEESNYRTYLGGSYCNLGNMIRNGGRASESLGWFDKAIATLTRTEPRNARAKQFLRNSHWGRARSNDALTKPAEAVKDWDRTIELSPPAEQLRYRASRATSRLQAGQVAEAVAEVAELTKSSNWNAGQWYDFACVCAVASGKIADKKQEYADRAMKLLHQAVKAGYKNVAHMAKDTDLDSLRGREDFKKLLADLSGQATTTSAVPDRSKK